MRALPLELLVNIFSRLEPYDLCTAASVSSVRTDSLAC
jgi:hypothetical protein